MEQVLVGNKKIIVDCVGDFHELRLPKRKTGFYRINRKIISLLKAQS